MRFSLLATVSLLILSPLSLAAPVTSAAPTPNISEVDQANSVTKPPSTLCMLFPLFCPPPAAGTEPETTPNISGPATANSTHPELNPTFPLTDAIPVVDNDIDKRSILKADKHAKCKLSDITKNKCGIGCMKDNLWRYDPTKHERKKLCRGEGFMKFDHWWLSHVGPCTDNNCPHEVEEIEDESDRWWNDFCGPW